VRGLYLCFFNLRRYAYKIVGQGCSKLLFTQTVEALVTSIEAPTPTIIPRANPDAAYDPDGCGASWLSYITSHDTLMASYMKLESSRMNHLTGHSFLTTGRISYTSDITSPAPIQCDGLSRRTVVSKVVITTGAGLYVTLFDIPDLPQTIPNPVDTPPPIPSCTIRQTDCQTKFAEISEQFSHYLNNQSATNGNRSGNPISPISGWANSLKEYAWVLHDNNLHNFFGGCGVPSKYCIGEAKDWGGPNERRTFDEYEAQMHCRVLADRLRLVYFPPEAVVARNICADNFFGANEIRNASGNTAIRTAMLSEIVFDEYWVDNSRTFKILF
jgi:hypothetical protein